MYDEHGRVIEEATFGPDKKPIAVAGGHVREVKTYDERGNHYSSHFFGIGRPILHANGYHEWTVQYDLRGNCLGEAYFGLQGEPVLVGDDRIARFTQAFDARNNRVEWIGFGVGAERISGRNGVSRVVSAYDARNRPVEVTYFDAQDRPTEDIRKVAREVYEDDRSGNRVRARTYGLDGKPR